MAHPIFVYGTLMSGRTHAGLLNDLARVPAHTHGELYRMPRGYPSMVLRGHGEVHGELVDPPDARVLALLDHYEGVDDGLYTREVIEVQVGLRTVKAWAYISGVEPIRKGGLLIPDGRWRG